MHLTVIVYTLSTYIRFTQTINVFSKNLYANECSLNYNNYSVLHELIRSVWLLVRGYPLGSSVL